MQGMAAEGSEIGAQIGAGVTVRAGAAGGRPSTISGTRSAVERRAGRENDVGDESRSTRRTPRLEHVPLKGYAVHARAEGAAHRGMF